MLVSALMMPVMVLADTPPAIPLAVYGDVKIDGANAPIGTIITVLNGASEAARTTTTQAGKYFLEVPASNAGASLTYKVNGTLAVEKVAANPVSVASDKIDLAITTAPSVCNPSSIANGTIGAYPQCAITCNSGYSLSNGVCTAISSGGGGGGGGGGGSSSSSSTSQTTSTSQTIPTVPLTPPMVTTPQVLGVKISAAEVQLNQILTDSAAIWTEKRDVILSNAGAKIDEAKEKTTSDKYISKLSGHRDLAGSEINRLNFFITYGTAGTKILGAGERAGVIGSYQAAFGKLPKTQAEWQDAIKIANGRWPSVKSAAAETKAKTSFKKIYGRDANMSNANDNAAVTIMAYGLRPSARNLNSEKVAILSFKYFYKRAPVSAVDWDAVRAIAYSGAKR